MRQQLAHFLLGSLVFLALAATSKAQTRPDGASDSSGPVIETSPSDLPVPINVDDEILSEQSLLDADVLPAESDCDEKKCAALKKKQAGAYRVLFYENDFSYLCDDCFNDCCLDCNCGEGWKRMCVHPGATLDVGGQYRARYHSEHNHRGLGLTGNSDDFLLHRTRLYGDLKFGSRFRAYVEYIDAVSFYEADNPRPIEENRSDLLNAFGEVLLWDDGCHEFRTRAGRQELLYGAQRTVSPLDWANTRRTFHGYKGMLTSANGCNVDGFYTNTVDPDTRNFDSINDDETFMGLYASRVCCNQTLELFYLRLDDDKNQGMIVQDFDFHTIGGRIQGSRGDLLYEAWGAYQFGENTDGTNHAAGAFTLGLGRSWDCVCWKPNLWVYYDWASGESIGVGDGNGYHHLFPLAHKYLGFMDLYGRRNIQTPNVRLTLTPHDRLTLTAWYYYFGLEDINDSPYSVVMTPYTANPSQARELGHEIDLIATYKIDARKSILFGYSHFFAGEYYETTTLPAGADGADADFFYTQFHVNF